MPDIIFEKLELVPEGLKEYAKTGTDGKFVVSVGPQAKISEFRDNNTTLARERDELKAKAATYEGIVGPDITKFSADLNEWKTTAQKVKDGTLKGTDAIAAEVENRTKAGREAYETQLREAGAALTAEKAERGKYEGLYRSALREQAITQAVMAKDSGANPTALSDILTRAAKVFQTKDDGTLVALNGKEVIYGADGATSMTPKEWLGKVLKEAPHLGMASSGGGAAGGAGLGQGGNITQTEAFKKLPPGARIREARKAGVIK